MIRIPARIAGSGGGTPFAALGLALALGGCGNNRDHTTILAAGHIEATEIRLSTKVGGVLASLPVNEGTVVTAGQEIARIDTVDIALLLAGARADRDQAAADLSLRLAGSRSEDIAAAAAQLARAAADFDGTERDLTRMQALLDAGSGTTKARDDALTRRDAARAAGDAAREQWRRLKTGSRREEIDAARARLAGAEARVAQFTQQIRDATLRSPVSGVLTEKLAEAGELLSPGTAIGVVTDLVHPWLTAYVGEPDLGRIRMGQEAEVVTDGGQKRMGKISFIAQTAEFTPKNVQTREERVKLVYKVKISLENPDGLFKPGMPAEARLRVAGGKP